MIPVMIAVTITVVLNLAWLCAYVVRIQRRRRLPKLRGDWWPHFERQFREYAMRISEDRPQAS